MDAELERRLGVIDKNIKEIKLSILGNGREGLTTRVKVLEDINIRQGKYLLGATTALFGLLAEVA